MARIMIVEDDGLQAYFLGSILESEGFDIVGPAKTVERALELLDVHGCDAAILDHNLDGTTQAIVVVLRRDGIPFLLLTASKREDLPPDYETVPVVFKPASAARLLQALRDLLA